MLPPFRIILTLGSAPLDITRYLASVFVKVVEIVSFVDISSYTSIDVFIVAFLWCQFIFLLVLQVIVPVCLISG